jgi:hypothetical protein
MIPSERIAMAADLPYDKIIARDFSGTGKLASNLMQVP